MSKLNTDHNTFENFNKVSCLTYLRKDQSTMVLRMLFNQRIVVESSELQILGI